MWGATCVRIMCRGTQQSGIRGKQFLNFTKSPAGYEVPLPVQHQDWRVCDHGGTGRASPGRPASRRMKCAEQHCHPDRLAGFTIFPVVGRANINRMVDRNADIFEHHVMAGSSAHTQRVSCFLNTHTIGARRNQKGPDARAFFVCPPMMPFSYLSMRRFQLCSTLIELSAPLKKS